MLWNLAPRADQNSLIIIWYRTPLNSGHLQVTKNFSVINRCPLLGGSLTKIVAFGSKHFACYLRHAHYWEVSPYLKLWIWPEIKNLGRFGLKIAMCSNFYEICHLVQIKYLELIVLTQNYRLEESLSQH